MRSRLLPPLAWGFILAGLGAVGIVLLATCFMIYDDEGYVLWSVRMFSEGRPLYTEVYSQYGPLFFVGYRLLHAATGIVFNNETGRLLTLTYWLGSALGAGLIAQVLTRRLLAGLLTAVLTFAFLFNNIREPFHPGSLLALFSVLAAGLGVWFITSDRVRHFTWSVALIAASMALIKINVGLFLGIALGSWMLLHTRWPARPQGLPRASVGIVAALSTTAVFLLLHSKLEETWALSVGLIFICGLFSVLLQLAQTRAALLGPRDWKLAALAAGFVALVVTVSTWLWGTPPSQLIDAVLLAPLRQPGVYSFPPTLPPGALPCALGALLGVFLAIRGALRSRLLDAIAFIQLAAAGFILFFIWDAITTNAWVRFTYAFGPSLAALFTFSTNENQTSPKNQARLWLAWVFIWQTLHAYPVAGTQLAWGSLLFIPLLVVACVDAADRLQLRAAFARPLVLAVLSLAALLAAGQLVHCARVWSRYSTRLNLPGARWLYLQPDLADTLPVLQRNLLRHADTVFSYPGMFSFNIWTGKPTPTAANVTHWFSILDRDQQTAIIEKLRADPRACVIMHRYHLAYLYQGGFVPDGPLKDFLFSDFAPAIRLGYYDLWVKRGRRIVAADTFRLDSGHARAWIARPGRPVARVCFFVPGRDLLELKWTLTPSTKDAPDSAVSAPPVDRLDAFVPVAWGGAAQLYLLDDHGAVISIILQNEAPNDAALVLPPALPAPAP
jgi:hypothetical protein